jgi:pimeloyl-ACP methyl ester carboxylesterase
MIADCAFARLSNGLRLAYVEQGERDGVAVLMLHGYSDSHRSYDLIRPLLPRAWRVIALTMRGHGRSDKPETGYAIGDFAADIPAFLDALGVERAIIVGHSLGAAVALETAANHPERVAGVALLGAFAGFREKPDIAALVAAVSGFTDPVDAGFIRDFQQGTVSTPNLRFIDIAVSESQRCPAHAWRAIGAALLAADPLAAAARCEAPAALIWGDKDNFVPRADQLALRDALASSRFFTLAGAGHAPHWERTADTAQLLIAFVAELDGWDDGLLRDAVFA